jgi:hypothetical protein
MVRQRATCLSIQVFGNPRRGTDTHQEAVIADGSRECALDDRLRDAIRSCGEMDCFASLAMTAWLFED